MRILTIVRDFGRRGTQRVAENFSTAYRQLGHDVQVLAFRHQGPRQQAFTAAGAEVLPPYEAEPKRCLERARSFGAELIHVHRAGVWRPDETALLSQLKHPSNVVLETNVFSRFDPKADPFLDLHAQLTRPGLYRWNQLEAGRSQGVGFYLPNPLDYRVWRRPEAIFLERLRQSLDLPKGVMLGTVGKAHPRLGTVIREVMRSRSDIFWLIVENQETLKALAALPTELRARCRTLPATDDDALLAQYYAMFDLLVHWSENGESFGMVLAESIAVGTPVVMPLQLHRDLGGIEVLGHEQGGWVAGSSRCFASVVLRALEDLPALRRGMGGALVRHQREYALPGVAERAVLAAETLLGTASGRIERARRLRGAGFELDFSRDAMAALLARHVGPTSWLEKALFWGTHQSRVNDVRRVVTNLRRVSSGG